MGKPSTLTSFVDRIRSGAIAHASSRDPTQDRPTLSASQPSAASAGVAKLPKESERGRTLDRHEDQFNESKPAAENVDRIHTRDYVDKSSHEPSSSFPNSQAPREKPPTLEEPSTPGKKPITIRMKDGIIRFGKHTKNALFHSWVNVLLIFVPIGIAVEVAHLSPGIIFAMNAIAVIPLAGILTHATESVASRLGDTLGALLNVSFGNAVELIIFIIALVKNEIRIVQASLLGSILANLLLILGMAFLLGGLRYQEQLYNSTVTQMSACLLSLSVMSLLLPTAFHASFSVKEEADADTLKMSRGTSIILLLVYVLYLVFQLKSHAYLYQSMPQEKIDEESHPGPLHELLETSSSSDSSTSSSNDTDTTSGSHTTRKRIKRAFKNRMRRKSSTTSDSTPSIPSHVPSPKPESSSHNGEAKGGSPQPGHSRRASVLDVIMSGDEGDDERNIRPNLAGISLVRDFETSGDVVVLSPDRVSSPDSHKPKSKKQKKKKSRSKKKAVETGADSEPRVVRDELDRAERGDVLHVGFVDDTTEIPATPGTGAIRSRPAFLARPRLPQLLSQNVFVDQGHGQPVQRPRTPRASSLPDLSRTRTVPGRGYHPSVIPRPAPKKVENDGDESEEEDEEPEMSRTVAVVMLLVSTGLVALCAEFLVDAIPAMTASSSVSQAFIGLIVLPIVGNAAEHVTAVTVAAKNKMDLAIGVAVGSSIQIALFVTPLVVLLGWCMGRPMSLYFNLFETVSLFVTAFVVNFLVLDGKSNYLEGTLLIASYIIIAVAAFFYPNGNSVSALGGSDSSNATTTARMMMAMLKV